MPNASKQLYKPLGHRKKDSDESNSGTPVTPKTWFTLDRSKLDSNAKLRV